MIVGVCVWVRARRVRARTTTYRALLASTLLDDNGLEQDSLLRTLSSRTNRFEAI